MGELVDNYQKHASNGSEKTEFEHVYTVTIPPLTQHMEPRVIAAAPMKVQYGAPETAREKGLDEAKIIADMKFQDAIGLFAVIKRLICPTSKIWLTELRFLDEKLTKLGMTLEEEGCEYMNSVFSAGQDLFHELADKDFCMRGVYHGKPFKLWPAKDNGEAVEPMVVMTRNKDAHGMHHTDSYTLETRKTAKPEEVMEHVAKLEQALEQWEKEVMRKHILKHGTIGGLE